MTKLVADWRERGDHFRECLHEKEKGKRKNKGEWVVGKKGERKIIVSGDFFMFLSLLRTHTYKS